LSTGKSSNIDISRKWRCTRDAADKLASQKTIQKSNSSNPDCGGEKRLRGDFFDFLKKAGITAAIKNPIPKEKANKHR
jgi:hypothetical protein